MRELQGAPTCIVNAKGRLHAVLWLHGMVIVLGMDSSLPEADENAPAAAGVDVGALPAEGRSLLNIMSTTQSETTPEETTAQLQAQMQQMQAQMQAQMTQMMELMRNGLAAQMPALPNPQAQPAHPTAAAEIAAVSPDLTRVYVYDLRSSARKYLPTIDDLLHMIDFPPPQVTPSRDVAAPALPYATPTRRSLALEPLQAHQVEATYTATLTEKNGKKVYKMHDIITINEVCALCVCRVCGLCARVRDLSADVSARVPDPRVFRRRPTLSTTSIIWTSSTR